MNISSGDIIGSIGVFILLLAFVLNLLNKISRDNVFYILMNAVGAALSCLASCLIHYIPFIILEAAWTIVSLIALFNYSRNK